MCLLAACRLPCKRTLASFQMAALVCQCSAFTLNRDMHTSEAVLPSRVCASIRSSSFPLGYVTPTHGHVTVPRTGLRSLSSQSEAPDGLRFGKIPIPERHIFFRSEDKLSAAFVNLRPIVPGHVLVVPLRVVEREKDLTEEESISVWLAMRRVNAVIEKHYNASALNLAIQDGRDAGQSIPHVRGGTLCCAAVDAV
jgi:hypothetical protein